MSNEKASIEIRLRNAGFQKIDIDSDDNCLFCNHYRVIEGDKIQACDLLEIKFGGTFAPENYICKKFDGSIFDNLIEGIKEENAAKAQVNRTTEGVQPRSGKLGQIFNRMKIQIKNKFK